VLYSMGTMTPLPITNPIIAVPLDLATTLGLEEAVLAQFLSEWASHQTAGEGNGAFHQLSREQLQRLLPFWKPLEIDRIARSLEDKGLLSIGSAPLAQGNKFQFRFPAEDGTVSPSGPPPVAGTTRLPRHWSPDENTLASLEHREGVSRQFAGEQVDPFVRKWHERAEPAHSWNEKFYRYTVQAWRRSQQHPEKTTIGRGWQPSEDAHSILEKSGIEKSFIEDAIPEFVLYWQEKDPAAGTWDSKFLQHIRVQWRLWQEALAQGIEPGLMPPDWQPPQEVYDILEKARINPQFAQEQVQEFVLYWREAGTPSKSWGSIFLRFVKRQWASQHDMINPGADEKWQRFMQRHTDTAWRHGA